MYRFTQHDQIRSNSEPAGHASHSVLPRLLTLPRLLQPAHLLDVPLQSWPDSYLYR
jgi:hypothetical protein